MEHSLRGLRPFSNNFEIVFGFCIYFLFHLCFHFLPQLPMCQKSNFDSFMWKQYHSTNISLKESIEVHLNRSKVFLLYFFDEYDISLSEEKFGRNTNYSCRPNICRELNHFMKNDRQS